MASGEMRARQRAIEALREQIAAAREERDQAKSACSAGIQAARAQILRMRAELAVAHSLVNQDRSSAPGDCLGDEAEDEAALRASRSQVSRDPAELDADRSQRQKQQLEARCLRLELAKLRHRTEQLEADCPTQEDEEARLRDELVHVQDKLASTRSMAEHHRLEVQEATYPYPQPGDEFVGSAFTSKKVALAGGRGNADAQAERGAREKTERKNEELSEKVKRLERVHAAQQLLIERLEKELLQEESAVQQTEMQLQGETRRRQHLKSVLRQCSDDMVAAALGVGLRSQEGSRMASTDSPFEGGGSRQMPPRSHNSSVASLPQIESGRAR